MLRIHKTYLALTLLLFTIEILIALFVRDRIVRPYVGDVLVVMLIYCFVRSFLKTPILPTAISVLAFACLIELLQYLQIVKRLGLEHSELAKTVIGHSFAWMDIWAYTAGAVLVVAGERVLMKRRPLKIFH